MNFYITVIFAITIILSGCKPENFQDIETLSIDDFYIIGTNNNTPNEIPDVNPYYMEGEFLVFIQLGKPDLGYDLTLYVSNVKSILDAEVIYHIECDDDEYCYDGDYFSLRCNYWPNMSGKCGTHQYDLSDSISTTPYSSYVIAKVCHRVKNQCVLQSQRIVFM